MPNDLMPNLAETYANSFNAGQQMRTARDRQNALALVATDPAAAQNALMQAGDFQGADALGRNLAQQRALKVQQDAAPLVQSGDYAGASKLAAAGGQYDVAGELAKLDDNQRAHAAQSAELVARAAHGLAQLPPEQRAAGLAKLAPLLAQQGITTDQLQKVDLSDTGLQQVAAQALSLKDQVDNARADRTQAATIENQKAERAQAAKNAGETARHNKADEGIQRQRVSGEGWQTLVDPANGGQAYRYNARTGQATSLDGAQPYAPQGAAKIGGGSPRSAAAMAVQQFLQDNPKATADDIVQFNSKLRAQAKATSDFATGSQGKTLNSLNVAIDHLGTMQEAADALHNGNVQIFNKIAKDIQTQTGSAAPTNFDTTKQIVTTEVVKAITGAGGGVADREHAQSVLSKANSPAQLSGAITQIKKLMAGQLSGLRTQYQSTTGQGDFESRLSPATRAELEGLTPSATAPASAGSVIHYDAQGNRVK